MPHGRKVVLFSDVAGTSGARDPLYMPLSLLAVGSMLKTHGVEVVIIDGQVTPGWRTRLEREIADACYLGVSALTGPSIAPALEAIAIARRRVDLPIVWGGYHATLAYRTILAEGLADYVVLGTGEQAAVHLADLLGADDRLPPRERIASLPNIAQIRSGNICVNRVGRMSTADLPPPLDYDLIDVGVYFETRPRTLHYLSSFGCPHACTFCAEPEHSGRIWKALPAARVADELLTLWHRYKPDRIGIMDPNFSSSAPRVLDIASRLRQSGAALHICCDMRATDVLRVARLAELATLRDAGFAEVYLGIESGSDRQLRRLRKSMTAAEALQACTLLAAAGIRTIASFMHDLPGETIEDNEATMHLARKLAALPGNEQRHHFFTPYPSTEIYDLITGEGGIGIQKTQADWAQTSTYRGSPVWRGRRQFRRTCLGRLAEIRTSLDDASRLTLPSLEDVPSPRASVGIPVS